MVMIAVIIYSEEHVDSFFSEKIIIMYHFFQVTPSMDINVQILTHFNHRV